MAAQAGMGPSAFASLSACRVRLNMSNGIAGIERADPVRRPELPAQRHLQAAPATPKQRQSGPKTDKNGRETSNPG